MALYNISNHPYLSGLTRKADLRELHVDRDKKQMIAEWNIMCYLDGTIVPELNKRIKTIGDNVAQIPTGETTPVLDENGNPVLDENGNPMTTPVLMGDYDIFEAQVAANIPIETILTNLIGYLDISGNINSKCNYRQ